MSARLYSLCCWPLVVIAAIGQQAHAQQPPRIVPNPQAPNLAIPVPLGMQRGTALDLTLTGTNLAGPTQLWTSFPAKVTIPTDMSNGKDNAKLRVRLEVPKDAPIGYHTIRLATTRGLSNFRLFCIDDLPQVLKVNTNRSKDSAQALAVPCVVVGKADAEVSDYFKITVKAGQRLSFDVLGRRLGSTFDPQLTLYDAKTGKELPDGHSNDAPGCQTDPRLTYVFKQAGDVLIEVRDVMYRGGPDYWFRLRIGDFPCATTPIPMAARRRSKVKVSFAGPAVEGVAPIDVTVPEDPTVDTISVAPRGASGLHGWPVALDVSDHEEAVEQEPNNEPAKANRIVVPGGITARFQEKGDVDCFVFTAKKGQRYVIDAQTHELGSPTEVYMVLKDAKGTQVAVSNPAVGQRIDFTAPADGDFVLVVEHLLYWGGPTESYRVTVTPFAADFELSVGLDRFELPQGAAAPISLFAVRRGYTGPIDITVMGPAGLSGQTQIDTGKPAAPNQPAGLLLLTSKPDLAPGAYAIVIQGKATIGGKTVTRFASVRALVSQQLANLPYPPRHLDHQIGVAVTEKPPFTLAIKFDHAEAVRGVPAPLTITATRSQGFAEEIALTPFNLPPNVTAALKSIPKDQTEVKAQLNPATNASLGAFAVSVIGRAKYQNRDFAVTAMPAALVLTLPFDLKVEATPLKVTQGGKAKLKVTAVRKGGYQGPITVQVRNLPANVTAAPATIAANQEAVEIEVTAAPNAALGDRAGVNVLGTATAAANQQNASAGFVVSVVQK
jgi:hypothetical protein